MNADTIATMMAERRAQKRMGAKRVGMRKSQTLEKPISRLRFSLPHPKTAERNGSNARRNGPGGPAFRGVRRWRLSMYALRTSWITTERNTRLARTPIHPGEILADELEELGVSPPELSRQIRVPANRIRQIVNGKRAITGDTALRLAHWFGTSPQFLDEPSDSL